MRGPRAIALLLALAWAGWTTSSRAADTIVAPVLVSDAVVAYPEGATGDATVILVVTVNADGTVRDVAAEEVNEPFSSLAVSAARGWTFTPASRETPQGTVTIAAKVRVAITFHPPAAPAAPTVTEKQAPEAARIAPPTPRTVARAAHVEEITVRGDRPEPGRTATLSRAEVRQIPGAFGDPFRAIESLPGVTPLVSGLPFFFIRGAPPGNAGYFVDGVRVPLLFHVGAGPSVIHPGLISRVDLYPGGYPARYGRFSGGIVAGETVPPGDELHGEYNLRLVDAGALVETPFANGKGTVLAAGRYSYTALLLTLLSPTVSLDYWDDQGRVTYDLGPQDRIGVLGFGSYDFLGQDLPDGTTRTLFGTEFHRIDTRYDHRLSNKGTIRTAATVGLDRTRLDAGRFLRDRILGTRTEIAYQLTPKANLRAGVDAQTDTYDIELGPTDFSPSQSRIAALFPQRSDLVAGVRADVVYDVLPRFEITPGARFDYFASDGATAVAVDPRLALRTRVTPRFSVLSAMGMAHQAPSFVIPVPGFQPGGLKGGLQRSVQESLGVEWEIGGSTTLTFTGFHNGFFDMSDPLGATPATVSGCRPGAFPLDTVAGDPGPQPTGNGSPCGVPRFKPGTAGPDRAGGGGQAADSQGGQDAANAFEVRTNGTSYGLELYLKRKLTERIGGFLSYTLSRSTRTSATRTYIATFDRTHVSSGALAYDLGRNWRAGARLVFYTGLPKAPDPTDPSATRLDPFFRVDLRLEKRWQLTRKAWLSFVAEWLNASLSKEAVATSCTLRGCQTQTIGPITIPSIGLEGGF